MVFILFNRVNIQKNTPQLSCFYVTTPLLRGAWECVITQHPIKPFKQLMPTSRLTDVKILRQKHQRHKLKDDAYATNLLSCF